MNLFCPLASGSKGNCIFVSTKNAKILIDSGISAKATRERLFSIGVNLEDIDAILITHEHLDHIRGLDILSGKMNIPVFSNFDTAKGICSQLKRKPKFKIFSTNEHFEFKDIKICPFSIQHDTSNPVGFLLEIENIKIGVCTDFGFVTTLIKNYLKNCDYLYIESNHEPSMVHASSRPVSCKQRILGRQGHISNQECSNLLSYVYHSNLKHIYLAHLSKECNNAELAMKKAKDKINKKDLSISIAYQDKVSKIIKF